MPTPSAYRLTRLVSSPRGAGSEIVWPWPPRKSEIRPGISASGERSESGLYVSHNSRRRRQAPGAGRRSVTPVGGHVEHAQAVQSPPPATGPPRRGTTTRAAPRLAAKFEPCQVADPLSGQSWRDDKRVQPGQVLRGDGRARLLVQGPLHGGPQDRVAERGDVFDVRVEVVADPVAVQVFPLGGIEGEAVVARWRRRLRRRPGRPRRRCRRHRGPASRRRPAGRRPPGPRCRRRPSPAARRGAPPPGSA